MYFAAVVGLPIPVAILTTVSTSATRIAATAGRRISTTASDAVARSLRYGGDLLNDQDAWASYAFDRRS